MYFQWKYNVVSKKNLILVNILKGEQCKKSLQLFWCVIIIIISSRGSGCLNDKNNNKYYKYYPQFFLLVLCLMFFFYTNNQNVIFCSGYCQIFYLVVIAASPLLYRNVSPVICFLRTSTYLDTYVCALVYTFRYIDT